MIYNIKDNHIVQLAYECINDLYKILYDSILSYSKIVTLRVLIIHRDLFMKQKEIL